jgi:hypothetical protein
MLFLSLIFSAILLVAANLAFRRPGMATGAVILAGALVVFPLLMRAILFVVPLHVIFLALLVAYCSVRHSSRVRFLALSCTGTVALYALFSAVGYSELARVKAAFPYVSLEDRLPAPKSAAGEVPLPGDAVGRLDHLEELVQQFGMQQSVFRVRALQRLHEDTVMVFAQQPAFGAARMPSVSEWALRSGERNDPPVPQPGTRLPPPLSPSLFHAPADKDPDCDDKLREFHLAGMVDFLRPAGFGFFKDRRHVVGFQEHQFSMVPEAVPGWQLRTVDLVGLAVHDEPVAYVSDNLPRMDELRGAPTRALDAFEATGLEALRKGEDLFVRDTPEARRALGSVRAVKQCVACHGCRRGELLGAFSYTLTRAGR